MFNTLRKFFAGIYIILIYFLYLYRKLNLVG